MQEYIRVGPRSNIREHPGVLMANLDTIKSQNSGTSFPTQELIEGQSCYRADQKKLYLLTDATAKTWQVAVDLNKTYATAENLKNYVKTSSISNSLTATGAGASTTVASSKAISDVNTKVVKTAKNLKSLTDKLSLSGSTMTLTSDLIVSKDRPILTLKSSKTGWDYKEKAAGILFGPEASGAFISSQAGNTLHFGLGGANTLTKPTYTAFEIEEKPFGMARTLTTFWSNTEQRGSFFRVYCNSEVSIEKAQLKAKKGLKVTGESDLQTIKATSVQCSSLTSSGNVSAFSDKRIKKDVETISEALQKVISLRGVMYTQKANDQRSIGLIAQEVEKVIPEAVAHVGDIKALAYGNLVGLLVEAVKELNEKVERNAAV